MKKIMKDALKEAKTLPRAVWIAAVVLPGGLVTVGLYLTGKSLLKSAKKGKEDDKGGDR